MIFKLSELKFEDGKLTRVQVARTGENMQHKLYGPITITKQDLIDMEVNFKANARGLSEGGKPILQFDYRHKDGEKAAGWIENLVLSDDGEKLYAETQFTPNGQKMIKEGEFKFSSPLIARDFINTDTNKKYNVILKGAGLTNIPFLHNMESITAFDEDGKKKALEYLTALEDMGTMEGILRAISDLSPEEQTEIALKISSKIKPKKEEGGIKMSEENAGTEPTEKEIALSEENETLKKEKETLEKEKVFTQMLAEGKVVPAQKEAFLSGDMGKFAELSEHVNLEGKGSGKTGDKIDTKDKADDKLHQLAEEYAEKNDVPYSDALSEVMFSEKNADLVALTDGD